MGSCFPFLSKEDNAHKLAMLIPMDLNMHKHTEEDRWTKGVQGWRWWEGVGGLTLSVYNQDDKVLSLTLSEWIRDKI